MIGSLLAAVQQTSSRRSLLNRASTGIERNMDYFHIPPISEVTLVEGGAMVTFEDGLCAIYSAAVLHACLSLAKIVSERTCEETKADLPNQ